MLLKKRAEQALINDTFLLRKYPGKGGWTYVSIPGDFQVKKQAFGFSRVRGFIDDYKLESTGLWSTKGGDFFLPVKAAIRKKIKKQEGDTVRVILYAAEERPDIPEDLLLCLQDEPAALKVFDSLSAPAKHEYIQWICEAKRDNTRVERIAQTINRLMHHQR